MVELKNAFAKEFKRSLIAHYGKVPSCAKIARDFTLISRELEPISSETVRKWLLGKNLPHSARLRTLVLWLNLDIKVFDEVLSKQESKPSLSHQKDHHLTSNCEKLIELFNQLNIESQHKVLEIAELYKNSPPFPPSKRSKEK